MSTALKLDPLIYEFDTKTDAKATMSGFVQRLKNP